MTITVNEFQRLGASLLERVRTSHEEVAITEFGKVVARLVPEEKAPHTKPWHALRGSVFIRGDLTEPVMTEAEVESALDSEEANLKLAHGS
jgi:antitoxin (DNA-binding transcriptional repressor) of toxin-antitoxin stability system